jgi:hypothetical protein
MSFAVNREMGIARDVSYVNQGPSATGEPVPQERKKPALPRLATLSGYVGSPDSRLQVMWAHYNVPTFAVLKAPDAQPRTVLASQQAPGGSAAGNENVRAWARQIIDASKGGRLPLAYVPVAIPYERGRLAAFGVFDALLGIGPFGKLGPAGRALLVDEIGRAISLTAWDGARDAKEFRLGMAAQLAEFSAVDSHDKAHRDPLAAAAIRVVGDAAELPELAGRVAAERRDLFAVSLKSASEELPPWAGPSVGPLVDLLRRTAERYNPPSRP